MGRAFGFGANSLLVPLEIKGKGGMFVEVMFCATVKRDKLGIPSIFIANVLPRSVPLDSMKMPIHEPSHLVEEVKQRIQLMNSVQQTDLASSSSSSESKINPFDLFE